MTKQQLSTEQKRLDTDIWIIALVTFGVFLCYAAMGNQLKDFVTDSSISVIPRLLLNAAIQFGVAGLGITIVCVLRREKFTHFGLTQKNAFKAIIGTIICFIPSICCIFLSGQFSGYQPFSILITDDVVASGIPFSIIGMALIAVVWGFFEGFNYAVVCEKIDRRYPAKKKWLDYGALTCAIICILLHPFSTSFWGIVEIITTFIAIYELERIMEEVEDIPGIAWEDCTLTRYDNDYQNAKESLEGLQNIVFLAIAVVSVICFLVLALFLTLRLRGRIHETGIYLAMGISKGEVLLQYLLEVFLAAAVALVLSYGASTMISHEIGKRLLSQVTAESYATVDLTAETGQEEAPAEDLGLEEIEVAVSGKDYAMVWGFGMVLCLASTALAAYPIMKLKPKSILSQMS